MKNITTAILSAFMVFGFAMGTASAQTDAQTDKKCGQLLKDAFNEAKKDKECRKDAINIFKALGKQFGECREFRQLKRACRQAKRSEMKTCRGAKKAAKRNCKAEFKACKSRCKKGKNGKACRKTCTANKRSCMSAARNAKKSCAQAARAAKKACKAEAKQAPAFAVCRDARKVTGKAAGKAMKCAGKYFAKPVGQCIKGLISSMNKDK